MTGTVTSPSAWVGCLACYNNGTLRGEWVNVEDLEDLDTATICPNPSHEEFTCMDHEGLPISGECSISEAYRYGLAVKEVTDTATDMGIPVDVALEYVGDSNCSPDNYPDIEDNYRGTAESEQDYVEEWLENSGVVLPSWVQVNYQDTFRELIEGCSVYRHEGNLYVFS